MLEPFFDEFDDSRSQNSWEQKDVLQKTFLLFTFYLLPKLQRNLNDLSLSLWRKKAKKVFEGQIPYPYTKIALKFVTLSGKKK